MTDPTSDEELQGLLPDYLNNLLSAEHRTAVDAWLARNAQARTDLQNLQCVIEEMDRLAETQARPDAGRRAAFLAHAQAHPLRRTPVRRRWWAHWHTAAWLKPAFSLAIAVVIGQGAMIGHLLRENDAADVASSRSVGAARSGAGVQRPVLSIQVAPDVPVADLLAAIRAVHGTIIFGTPEDAILTIELSDMPAAEATRRLRQAKAIVSVTDAPETRPGR